MTPALVLISLLVLGGAACAFALRNLVRSVLLLVASWAGIALFFLWAGAEFAGFAQLLVYVGAVSMLALFAVLLTRAGWEEQPDASLVGRVLPALLAGGAVAGVLVAAVVATPLEETGGAPPVLPVRELGVLLAGRHAASLLAAGALLTVALVGAVTIAAPERRRNERDRP